MALPKLTTPTYELVLPSTGEKIKFRPGAEIPDEYGRYNLSEIFSNERLKFNLSDSKYFDLRL